MKLFFQNKSDGRQESGPSIPLSMELPCSAPGGAEQIPPFYQMSELLAQGKVKEVILKVDEEAEQRKERLIQQFLLKQPMPDTEDTMERAGHMNSLTKQAEEIVLDELVMKVR